MTHLVVHRLDRPHWSAPTVCGKFKRKKHSLTGDVCLVDCPGCRWWIDGWTPELVREMFDNVEWIDV